MMLHTSIPLFLVVGATFGSHITYQTEEKGGKREETFQKPLEGTHKVIEGKAREQRKDIQKEGEKLRQLREKIAAEKERLRKIREDVKAERKREDTHKAEEERLRKLRDDTHKAEEERLRKLREDTHKAEEERLRKLREKV
ncbi:unnamed protein product [Cylicocyclus nassatus]|uniref:Uncharacterized protein n=1 Tax=Cylicocyclus nassatus TaxID=53992 RepID=A0AA36GDW6_CYLNA|nr:unnamed protein product [Cylicocyclus nassatus]